MAVELNDLDRKWLAFVLDMNRVDEKHLIIRKVMVRNGALMVMDDDLPPPFMLPPSWLARIQPVPAEQKEAYGNADFFVPLVDVDAGSALYKGLKKSVVQKNFGK